jgi:adenine-specific DNA-methyltransferase
MLQQALFDEVVVTPPTEGIKYAGSKLKLLPHIIELVRSTDAKVILDGFSGTTRVSQALSQLGYRIIANDVAVWSKTFGYCYLLNQHPPSHYAELIAHLNALPPKFGWYSQQYGGYPNDGSARHED